MSKVDDILAKYGAKRSGDMGNLGAASAASSRSDEILRKYGAKRSGDVTYITSDAGEPSLLDRVGNAIAGAAKSTASGYASALGTTQAVTGGVARKNYLTTDIDQWQKELETYRYKAKNADNAEEQKYFLLEAGKTANKIEAARANLKETETAGKAMQQTAKKLSASAQQDIQEAKQGLGKVGSFLVDTGVAGAQMLGDIAVGAVTGGSALPAMFVRSAGSSAQEAREAGGTLGQQVAYGLGSGALSVATEKLLNVSAPFKKVFGEGVLDSAITKATGKLGSTTLGKVALSAISEGGEEFVEALVQPILQRATYSKDASFDLSQALYDAAIGAALGGIGGGVETVTSHKQTAAKPQNPAMPGAGTQTVQTAGTGKGMAKNTVQGKSGGILEQEIERLFGKKNAASKGGGTATIQSPSVSTTPVQTPVAAFSPVETARTKANPAQQKAGVTGQTSALPTSSQELDSSMPQSVSSARDPLVEAIFSGKRVAQAKLSTESFESLAERQDVGIDAGNNAFQIQPENHIDQRTQESVAAKGVNAFTFDHPELHSYMQRAANALIADAELSQTFPVQRRYERTMQGNKVKQAAQTSEHLRKAMDETGLSRSEIIDAAQRIVDDHGQENVKAAKAVELILDDMLTNGYKPMFGEAVAANEAYIAAKGNILGSQPTAQEEADWVKATAPLAEERIDNLGSARGGFSPFTAAQMEYGTMDDGENAVRPDDVPVSTNGTDRVSRSVVTAKGAAVTPDEFVPLLENATMNGDFSYIPITNSDTVQQAMGRITHVGWDAARAEWTANVRRGRAGADITAMGGLLYNHAVNAGDTQAALDIFTDYQQAVRNSAQGLQAARILKTLTPDSRLYMIQRSIESMIERLGLPEGITIDDGLIQEYRNATTDAERDEIIIRMQQNVADQIPSTLMDRWTALRYVNMLGNFKTQVRNIAGNVGMRAVSSTRNAVAATLERLAGTERTKSVTVVRDLLRATSGDFENVRGEAMGEGRYSDERMDPDTFWQGVEERRRIFRTGAMEGYRRATNWAMNNQYFGDEAFSRGAYARALAGYLKAQNVSAAEFTDQDWQRTHSDFLDRARQYAIQEAQETTFRDHNAFSDWVARAGRRQDTPRAVRAVSEGMMPFRRTPANVLLRAEEYSPLGLVNTAVLEIWRRTGGEVTGAEVVNSLAKALTGTGVFALGMALSNLGLLRGADSDDEDQAAFDDLTGHQAYSLELPGGTSVTLDWLTPLAMPLFMGAQLEELRQEDGLELKDLEQALLSIADPMLQMSMMQGINDTLEDLKYTDSSNLGQMAVTAALGYLTQGLTNSLLGQAERVAEDESTMTYVDKESAVPAWMQREIGTASRKVPGWDYNQVSYIDAWGREEEQGDVLERSINSLFNPSYISQVDVDKVESELQRVKDATGSTSVFPDRAEKSVTLNGETKALTAEEYQTYAKALGQERYQLAKEATASSAYKAMSDADKAACIAKLYSVARAKTLKEIFPDYEPSAELAGYLEAESQGVDPVEFYTFKAGINGAKSDEESSRQEKVMAAIDAMEISRKEKDFLFYLKYPKGDAGKAPWN